MRQLVQATLLAIMLTIVGVVTPAFSESETWVLYRSDIPLYREIARCLQENRRVRIVPCPIESLSVSYIESHTPTAIIALGDAGLKRALQISWIVPIITTLVDAVPSDERVQLLSTNQPIELQIALLQRLLPRLKRIWIPSIDPRYAPSAEGIHGLSTGVVDIDTRSIPTPRDLLPALRSLEPGNSAIILSPDPGLMNEATLQSIFLTSFQKQCPVVGFSEGLVKKGAVAAFVLAPEQVASELLEFAGSLIGKRSRENRTFTGWRLILNRTVLEKLGVPFPADLASTAFKLL